ncbi:MAG: hypothetical protein VSS75_005955 [Candidatus Parabeggiatoa sp.]|nr:hypothetical protein [Candidatus Parabeggiatoa sp.]
MLRVSVSIQGDASLETHGRASLQWKQSLILSTFGKLIGGKIVLQCR